MLHCDPQFDGGASVKSANDAVLGKANWDSPAASLSLKNRLKLMHDAMCREVPESKN
jgi:hypothetical protein